MPDYPPHSPALEAYQRHVEFWPTDNIVHAFADAAIDECIAANKANLKDWDDERDELIAENAELLKVVDAAIKDTKYFEAERDAERDKAQVLAEQRDAFEKLRDAEHEESERLREGRDVWRTLAKRAEADRDAEHERAEALDEILRRIENTDIAAEHEARVVAEAKAISEAERADEFHVHWGECAERAEKAEALLLEAIRNWRACGDDSVLCPPRIHPDSTDDEILELLAGLVAARYEKEHEA